MEKQHCIAFINAINAAQPYVPPFIFSAIINSDIARVVAAIANDQAVCQVVNPADMPQPKANGQDLPANE